MDITLVTAVEISVIIPSYNAEQVIAAQLEALANQQWRGTWEVIVADNGSTDRTLEVVEQYRSRLPGLRLVDASDRRGAAHARNLGAQAAQGQYIIFVDSDDVIAPAFIDAMAEALTKHDFVAPRLEALTLNHHWTARLGEHPQYFGLMRYYNEPFLYHAGGCGLGLRRSVFLGLGGFDESVIELEDSEFCFRAQLAGVEMHFVPDAVISVRNRASLRGMLRQSRRWGRAEVGMAIRYRGRTSPARALYLWLRYFGRWAKLLLMLPSLRSRTYVARWFQEAARQVGILEASLRKFAAPI
jgi:glycosyltransferase involved in cell wall biosynthesis